MNPTTAALIDDDESEASVDFYEDMKAQYDNDPEDLKIYYSLFDLGSIFYNHPDLEKLYHATYSAGKNKFARYEIAVGTISSLKPIIKDECFLESLLKFYKSIFDPKFWEDIARSLNENRDIINIIIFGTKLELKYSAGQYKNIKKPTIIAATSAIFMSKYILLLWIGVSNVKTDASWGCPQERFKFRQQHLGSLMLVTIQNLSFL